MIFKTVRLGNLPAIPDSLWAIPVMLTSFGHRWMRRVILIDFKWAAVKQLCTVKRIQNDHEVEFGLLVLNRHGKWVFSYAVGDDDDETLFRLADHRFNPGEYISITEHDGIRRRSR